MQNCRRWAADIFYLSRKTTRDGADSLKDEMNAVIFRSKGYRFFFYSNEGSPIEPVHVHVRSGRGEAKFWLHPMVYSDNSSGFDARISGSG
jgi:Domain of unknown function (DUF4160)